MTQEEKAEAYDRAIVRARRMFSEKELKFLFPEFEESESKQIRKDLIQWINEFPDIIWRGHYKKDVITYLENKMSKKPIISDDALREGISHFGITQYQIDNWLKKYVDVEKQVGQKVANNVEPKFKVGDWCIDNEDGTIFQIVKVLDNTYKYRTNEGKE